MQRGLRHLARCGVKTVHTASRWNGTAPPQQQQQQPPTPEEVAEHQAKLAEKIATSRAALEEAVAKEPVSRAVAAGKFRLAQFLLASGDKEGAGRELIEGLAVQKQVEPDTLSYARSCFFVARVLAAELSRHDEEAVLMNEAIAIHENTSETTDPTELSKLYFSVAQGELQKGEYDAAEISFEKWCKNIAEMNQTEDTKLMLAHKHCSIADLFRASNEGRRAAKHYMKAVPILETYAPDDERTANAMYCYSTLVLAGTFEGVENTETKKATELDAIRMCHKILDMQVIKPGSTQEVIICNVLGGLYLKQGLFTRALEFEERALEIQDAVGAPNTVIVEILSALVPLYKELGRTEDAERTEARMKTLMATAQAKHEKTNSQSVENETTDPKELSELYSTVLQEELENGEFDEAEISCEKCCKNIAKMYETEAETKLMIARQHCILAELFETNGEYHRALKYNMKAIPVFETYGPEAEATAILYYRISRVHAGIAQGEENAEIRKSAELDAIKMCHKSLVITQGIKPGSNRASIHALFSGSKKEADICSFLGMVYLMQGLSTHALEFLERAVKIYGAVDVGVPDTVVVETVSALVLLYKELGRTEDAERTEARMKTLMATA